MPSNRRFELSGEQLQAVRKFLKPALPKKAQQKDSTAQIRVERGLVQFAIPGATTETTAATSGTFVVQMPWREFAVVLTEPVGATAAFAFEPGAFTFNGVTSRSTTIVVEDTMDAPGRFGRPVSSAPLAVSPDEAAVRHPLLAAYQFTRTHGIRSTLGNKNLLRQQLKVEALLDEAAEILHPLGVARGEIEAIVARKLGELP